MKPDRLFIKRLTLLDDMPGAMEAYRVSDWNHYWIEAIRVITDNPERFSRSISLPPGDTAF